MGWICLSGMKEFAVSLEVNIAELALLNRSSVIVQYAIEVVLFDLYVVAIDARHPGDMAVTTSIRLRNGADSGVIVDDKTSSPSCVVPAVGVAPACIHIVVGERDFGFVQLPCDKASTLASGESPVVYTTTIAPVWIVAAGTAAAVA